MTTNQTEAQMKLARECAAHGFPKDMPYYKNCMAGNYDEFGIVQAPLLAIQATEARAQGLVEALTAVHDDLLMRAEIEGDEKIVAVGTGVWVKVCNALATWRRT